MTEKFSLVAVEAVVYGLTARELALGVGLHLCIAVAIGMAWQMSAQAKPLARMIGVRLIAVIDNWQRQRAMWPPAMELCLIRVGD